MTKQTEGAKKREKVEQQRVKEGEESEGMRKTEGKERRIAEKGKVR